MEGKIEGRKGVSNRENQREERECGRNHIKRSLRRREEGRTCAWCCGLSWFQVLPTGSTFCESTFASETLLSSGTLCFCIHEVFGANVLSEREESYIAGKRDQMSLKSSKLSLFLKKLLFPLLPDLKVQFARIIYPVWIKISKLEVLVAQQPRTMKGPLGLGH